MNTHELLRFVGNPAAYALQQEDGTYKPVRKDVTTGLLKQHLQGQLVVGTYVNVGSMARFVCFDVDSGDDAYGQAGQVVEAITEMGVPEFCVGVEFSGRKGYHVWVPLQEFREASELRRFGRAVLALAGVECEVFPKQDVARDLGNLVKLPGGKHRVSGMASEWKGDVPKHCPPVRWTEDVLPNLPVEVAGRRAAGAAAERFPCMDAIMTEGATVGSRNNELFHLATMLRRAGLTQEYTELVVRTVNERGEAVSEFELASLLESAEHSGPICDTLPSERQCGDVCIRARTAGLYTRPRQLKHAAEGENVVVTLLKRAGRTVVLGHDDLETAKGMLT